jgi:hypothetical protein
MQQPYFGSVILTQSKEVRSVRSRPRWRDEKYQSHRTKTKDRQHATMRGASTYDRLAT